MRRFVMVPVIVVVSMVATWCCGWWGVVLVAAIAGIIWRADGGRPWRVALATMIGWLLLLAFDALRGPLMHVVGTVAGVMKAPDVLLLLVTVLLAGLLAWSASTVAGEIGQLCNRAEHR